MQSTIERAKSENCSRDKSGANILVRSSKFAFQFILAFAFAIAALELVFAIGGLGEECFMELKPVYGFGQIYNKRITWRSEGYSSTVFGPWGRLSSSSSTAGKEALDLPRQTADAAAPDESVLCLGDSVVESLQVPDSKSFARLIEQDLRIAGINARVFNSGVSAYGTLQEYLQYKELAAKLKPSVLLLFYHQGDSGDNMLIDGVNNFFPRPYCNLDPAGNLVFDWGFYNQYMSGGAADNFCKLDFIRKNSRVFGVFSKVDLMLGSNNLYNECKSVFNKISSKLSRYLSKNAGLLSASHAQGTAHSGPGNTLPDGFICRAEQMRKIQNLAAQSPATMLATAGIISALAAECRANSCRFVVIGLPAAVENFEFRKELKVLNRLADCRENQFEFIDLNRQFLKLPADIRENSYFVYGDHLKAKGHELVARLVYDSIWKEKGSRARFNENQK